MHFCVFFKGHGQPLFSTVNLLFAVYLICRLEAICVYFSTVLDVLGSSHLDGDVI